MAPESSVNVGARVRVERRPGVPRHGGARQGIEDARARANRGLGVQRISEAEAWGHIVVVGVKRRPGVVVGELVHTFQVCSRAR